MKILFIGERITDLGGYNDTNGWNAQIQDEIERIIKDMKASGEVSVLTSLNLGVEFWAGEIAQRNKVPTVYYSPFSTHGSRWPDAVKASMNGMIKKSTRVQVDDGDFEPIKIFKCEERMCDDADAIFVFYKGPNNRTKYIKKIGKEFANLLDPIMNPSSKEAVKLNNDEQIPF